MAWKACSIILGGENEASLPKMSDSIVAYAEHKSGKRTVKVSRTGMKELKEVNIIWVTKKEKQEVISLIFCFFYCIKDSNIVEYLLKNTQTILIVPFEELHIILLIMKHLHLRQKVKKRSGWTL